MIDAATIKAALDCGKSGCGCKRNGTTHCPCGSAHNNGDAKPSLSVGERAGKILVHCNAGCSQEDVIAALTELQLWPAPESNAPIPMRKPRGALQLMQEWTYPNDGTPAIAVHGRFEDSAGNKDVKWRLPGGEYADGLGGLKLASLPLYNAHLLVERPDEPWVLVEGERAADAAVEHGLLAVSLCGGAAQTDFGAALEPLKGRAGWLWPDNDDPGRKLMRRVAPALSHARFVTLPADLPERADAAEFFQLGHDVGALFVDSNAPAVTVTEGAAAVALPYEGGRVEFVFAYITYHAGAMDAELTVTPRLVGVAQDTFTAHLTVTSISSRDQFRRTLDKQYMLGKDFNWTALLNRACQLARAAYLEAPASIDIEDVTIVPGDDYRVDRFAPKSGVCVVFGMGDSLKGHTMISLSLAINAGASWLGRRTVPTNALYLDYEDDRQTMARRRTRHILGLPDGISVPAGALHYMPGGGVGVTDQIDTIARELRKTCSGVLIIDSAILACGGDPIKADVVGRMFSALNALGVTVILIAHTDKAENEAMPYGSVVWHNGARQTWYVKRTKGDDESPEAVIGFYCKKSNNDMRPKPFGVKVTFDDAGERLGPITVAPYDLRDDDEQESRLGLTDRIAGAVRGNPLTYPDLAECLGVKENSVRRAVQRSRARFVVTDAAGRLVVSNREVRLESA
jgi:hypothetical protein